MEATIATVSDYFKDLSFNAEEHIYSVKGEKLQTSVSGQIYDFCDPFDREKISSIIAERDGVTQESLYKEWEESADFGSTVHDFAEMFVNDRSLIPSTPHEEAVVKFWNDLPDFVVPVFLELRMYHKKYMFAGTTDVVLCNKRTNQFIIADYKTNKDLFYNFKNNKLQYPFHNLLDSPFNKYQLQLSYYQILLEQLNIKVSTRKIIWLKPEGHYEIYEAQDFTKILNQHLAHKN